MGSVGPQCRSPPHRVLPSNRFRPLSPPGPPAMSRSAIDKLPSWPIHEALRLINEVGREADFETGHGLQPLHYLVGQADVQGGKVIFQLVKAAGSENGVHGAGAVHGPGDRDLRGCDTKVLGDVADGGGDRPCRSVSEASSTRVPGSTGPGRVNLPLSSPPPSGPHAATLSPSASAAGISSRSASRSAKL